MQNDMNSLPTRGNDAVEILVNDHQTIKSLLSALTSDSFQQQQATLESLKAALTIHNATEENLVYPALREVAGKKSESQHLYQETAEADVLVFQLDTMIKTGNIDEFQTTAKKLQKAVLEHIEDEEQKAFPALQQRADGSQARMLTDAVRQFRGSLHMKGQMPSTQGRMETGEIADTKTQQGSRMK